MSHLTILRTLVLAVACALSTSALADSDTPKTVNVVAGDLTDALESLARQCGVDVVYPSSQINGLKTEGVSGTLETKEAFQKLLKGTALVVRQDGESVLIMMPTKSNTAQGNTDIHLAQNTQSTDSSASPSEASSEGSEDKSVKLQEIVVTAQKREERLQDVPISISVLSGESLDRATFDGTREALNTVPGVSILTNQNHSPMVSVRGVSASSARNTGASTSAYYVDGVPFGLVKSAVVPDSDPYDLERIEVLRGPQGTLYGASALNGVIRILTRDADLQGFDFKVRGLTSNTEFGDWNYSGNAAVNLPIIDDKLAARAVVSYQDFSGWIDKPNDQDANDLKSRTVRLKINAQPTDRLSMGVSGWFSRIDNGATALADDDGRHGSVVAEPNSDDFDTYGFKVGYKLPGFSVTSMTSYIKYRANNILDLVAFGLPGVLLVNDLNSDTFAEEILLSSTHGGPWRWSVGGIYRDVEDRNTQLLPPLITGFFQDRTDTSESFAVFGEVTRIFLDGKLELTGGLRYFEDDVGIQDRLSAAGGSNTFTDVSPRAVLTWLPSSDLTVYASYAEGFRSGVNQETNVFGLVPPAEPDSLTNYEVGTKGDLLNGRVSFDAAVYYIDWQDFQQVRAFPVTGPDGRIIPLAAVINGESASGLGVDLGMTVRPAERLTLGASISWNDLTLDEDVFSVGTLLGEKGSRLQASPEYSFAALANYAFSLGHDLEGRLSGSANYVSEQGGFGSTSPGDSILISRASLSIHSQDRWAATLSIDNANNEQDTVGPAHSVSYLHLRARPRTIGLQLEYRY